MFAAVSRAFFIFFVFAKLNYGAADICAAPPPIVNPSKCCEFPCLFDKSVLDACGAQALCEDTFELPSCDVLACLFKHVNIIKEDQKIDVEGAKAYLSKLIADYPEWTSQSEEIGNKCFSPATLQSGPPDMCGPVKVTMCATKTFLSTCPANHWTASEQCENLRTYLQQCHSH